MLKNLTLTRPLVALDCETTGLDTSTARIVELGAVKVHPDGSLDALVWRVNPGVPIPPAATAIHGIRDGDVADCRSFESVGVTLWHFVEYCDLAGFNVCGYDLPLIAAELCRHGVPPFGLADTAVLDAALVYWAHVSYDAARRRTLANAVAKYIGRHHDRAHGALADALATLEVLDAQVVVHGLPNTVPELAKWIASYGG